MMIAAVAVFYALSLLLFLPLQCASPDSLLFSPYNTTLWQVQAYLAQLSTFQLNITKALIDCYYSKLDAAWPNWALHVEQNEKVQRRQLQRWLEDPCVTTHGKRSSLPAGLTDKNNLCVYDLLYARKHGGDLQHYTNYLRSNPTLYMDKLYSDDLFLLYDVQPQRCKYSIDIVAAQDSYEIHVSIYQHSCEALHRGGSAFQIMSHELNQHLVCYEVDSNQVLTSSPSRKPPSTMFTYAFKCHLIVDHLFFSHLVSEKKRAEGPGSSTRHLESSQKHDSHRDQQRLLSVNHQRAGLQQSLPQQRNHPPLPKYEVEGGPHYKHNVLDVQKHFTLHYRDLYRSFEQYGVNTMQSEDSVIRSILNANQPNQATTDQVLGQERYSLSAHAQRSLSPMRRFLFDHLPLNIHDDKGPDNLRVCVTVCVLLHYESFDMYSEIFPASLGVVLLTRPLCMHMPNKSELSTTSHPMLREIRHHLMRTADSSHSQHALKQLRSYREVLFAGASHMRYLWDCAVANFLPRGYTYLPLQRKHSSASAEHLRYEALRLLTDVPLFLERTCDGIEEALKLRSLPIDVHLMDAFLIDLFTQPHMHSLHLQFGAWDLTATGVLYLLTSPVMLDRLIASLVRVANRPCAYFLSITMYTTLPTPLALENAVQDFYVRMLSPYLRAHPSQVEKFVRHMRYVVIARGYRVRQSVAALGATLQQRLGQLEYPSSSIQRKYDGYKQRVKAILALSSNHSALEAFAESLASNFSIYSKRAALAHVDLHSLLSAFSEESVDNVHYLRVDRDGGDAGARVVTSLGGETMWGAMLKYLLH